MEVNINKDASKAATWTADFLPRCGTDVLSGEEELTLQHSTNILSLSRALLSPPAVTIRFSGSLVIFCENK